MKCGGLIIMIITWGAGERISHGGRRSWCPTSCPLRSTLSPTRYPVFCICFAFWISFVIFGPLFRCSPPHNVSVFVYSCSLVRCGPLSLQAGVQVSFWVHEDLLHYLWLARSPVRPPARKNFVSSFSPCTPITLVPPPSVSPASPVNPVTPINLINLVTPINFVNPSSWCTFHFQSRGPF